MSEPGGGAGRSDAPDVDGLPPFVRRGGVQGPWVRASWPFAKLEVTDSSLRVSCWPNPSDEVTKAGGGFVSSKPTAFGRWMRLDDDRGPGTLRFSCPGMAKVWVELDRRGWDVKEIKPWATRW